MQDEAVEVVLTKKDELDVQKSLAEFMRKLDEVPGLTDNDKDLISKSALEAIRLAKRLAKKKYTPKKYRKVEWKY